MGWLKGLGVALVSSCAVYAATVNNPIMYVDSPDPSIVRVDDAYYMVTTTMHFAPGVPVFKSTDLAVSVVQLQDLKILKPEQKFTDMILMQWYLNIFLLLFLLALL